MAVWVTFSDPMRLQHGVCVILIGVYVSKISGRPLHVSMDVVAVAFAIIAKRLKAIVAMCVYTYVNT